MKRVLLVLAAFCSLMLASCSGGGASTKINVTLTEFQYQPSHFTVPAGQQITLQASNNGSDVHSFVIMKLGTQVGDTFGPADESNVYWQTLLQPGASVTTTFTAPAQPGDYQVVCKEQGHIAAGMVATLTVVPAAK